MTKRPDLGQVIAGVLRRRLRTMRANRTFVASPDVTLNKIVGGNHALIVKGERDVSLTQALRYAALFDVDPRLLLTPSTVPMEEIEASTYTPIREWTIRRRIAVSVRSWAEDRGWGQRLVAIHTGHKGARYWMTIDEPHNGRWWRCPIPRTYSFLDAMGLDPVKVLFNPIRTRPWHPQAEPKIVIEPAVRERLVRKKPPNP